jgi:hypothetical protein
LERGLAVALGGLSITMTTPASIRPSAPGTKPAAPRPLAAICLAAGAVLLAAGCCLGIAIADDRAWSLTLLLGSVVLFATACAFEFRLRAVPAADKLASAAVVKEPIAATASATPAPAPSTALAKPVVMAVAVVAPPAGAATPVQARPAAALQLTPPERTTAPVQAATASATQKADAPLDVAALMKAPLSDLLLAALCKDPQGTRRIFAQALLQNDPGIEPANVAQSHAASQPAAS